jgi:hypothetical protein
MVLNHPSITNPESVMQIEDTYKILEWARNVVEHLKEGKLPKDNEARQTRMQSAQYTFVGDALYRRAYTLPLLKCLSIAEAEYVFKEIHEGVCGSHSGGSVRAGYYWPTIN